SLPIRGPEDNSASTLKSKEVPREPIAPRPPRSQGDPGGRRRAARPLVDPRSPSQPVPGVDGRERGAGAANAPSPQARARAARRHPPPGRQRLRANRAGAGIVSGSESLHYERLRQGIGPPAGVQRPSGRLSVQ